MSEAPKIYATISAAMADINPVGKGKYNQKQGFKYRGIDDVMNALYPVLTRHGLFLVPEVLDHSREERATKSSGNLIYSILKMRYTLYATDGSSVSAVVIGEGMDIADKSSNKAMAVAMKYALFQLFCIPTEEMGNDDPDGHSPGESFPAKANQPYEQQPPVQKTPSVYSPNAEIATIKQRYGVDKDGFARMRETLIAGGVVPALDSAAMTEADWRKLFDAIYSNFGDRQEGAQ